MPQHLAQFADGWKFGQAIKIQVGHRNRTSIRVFDRCGSNACSNSMIAPIQKFDAAGNFARACGGNIFNFPHGLFVANEGNVWVFDERAKTGAVQPPGPKSC
jgi:hypothetical protein